MRGSVQQGIFSTPCTASPANHRCGGLRAAAAILKDDCRHCLVAASHLAARAIAALNIHYAKYTTLPVYLPIYLT